MIEALTAKATDEALAERFHIRVKTDDDFDVRSLNDVVKYRPELAVTIANEKPWCSVECGVAELLSGPLLSRMVGHSTVDDFSCVVLDDDEGEDLAESNVVGLHEIAGPDLMGVVFQEG